RSRARADVAPDRVEPAAWLHGPLPRRERERDEAAWRACSGLCTAGRSAATATAGRVGCADYVLPALRLVDGGTAEWAPGQRAGQVALARASVVPAQLAVVAGHEDEAGFGRHDPVAQHRRACVRRTAGRDGLRIVSDRNLPSDRAGVEVVRR